MGIAGACLLYKTIVQQFNTRKNLGKRTFFPLLLLGRFFFFLLPLKSFTSSSSTMEGGLIFFAQPCTTGSGSVAFSGSMSVAGAATTAVLDTRAGGKDVVVFVVNDATAAPTGRRDVVVLAF